MTVAMLMKNTVTAAEKYIAEEGVQNEQRG